jgi:hypothetical protein
MVSSKSVAVALFALFAFTGLVKQVHADEEVVTITATRTEEKAAPATACEGLSANESSRLAREAEGDGAWQRASDCFVVAGEYMRAHRASARVASEAAAAQRRNASMAAANARSQMARIRAAFR